ncbi:MAG: DsbA family protein, partial [Nitrososphaera sp.]|nr:DsbA family protein [Nitrososphaera sp.]
MAEDSVKISKDTLYGIVIVCLVALIALSIMTSGFGVVKTQAAGAVNNGGTTGGTTGGTAVTGSQMVALMDDDMKIGSDTAPVVIVEFSDFQCPFCRKFWTDSYQNIKKDYI